MSKNPTLPSVSNTRKLTHTFSNIFDNKESQFTRPTTDVPDTLCRFWNISRGSEACSYFYEPLAPDEDPDKYSFAVCFICSKDRFWEPLKYTCSCKNIKKAVHYSCWHNSKQEIIKCRDCKEYYKVPMDMQTFSKMVSEWWENYSVTNVFLIGISLWIISGIIIFTITKLSKFENN